MIFSCIITLSIVLASIFMVNGLQCYHCRLNLCDHEYCESAMSLFKESSPETAEYIGVQNWSSIAPCPADWQTANQSGSHAAEFQQTCLQLGDMCGQLVYNITTKSVLNIVSNDSHSVPVIGSGTNVFKSAVVVLGCIPISHKCRSGYKQSGILGSSPDVSATTSTAAPASAPAASNSSAGSRAIVSKLSNQENINTVSNCCHCDQDLCNGNDLISKNGTVPATQTLHCTNAIHQPSFDDLASKATISHGTHEFLIAILVPLIAVLVVEK